MTNFRSTEGSTIVKISRWQDTIFSDRTLIEKKILGIKFHPSPFIYLACEQAFHLGDIVESTRASGTRHETLRRSLARLALLAQIGELARRLSFIMHT